MMSPTVLCFSGWLLDMKLNAKISFKIPQTQTQQKVQGSIGARSTEYSIFLYWPVS